MRKHINPRTDPDSVILGEETDGPLDEGITDLGNWAVSQAEASGLF